MLRILVLLILAASTVGVAWQIEQLARPATDREGRVISGEHSH